MIGTWRVCGTAAGIAPRLIHCDDPEPAGEVDHVGGELPPAVVGFRPDEDEQVAFLEPRPAQDEARPGQLGQAPVDDLERRAARSIVEQLVGVEGRDGRAVVGQDGQRGRGRRARIDPAVERGDQDGRDQIDGSRRACTGSPAKDRRRADRWSRADLGYTRPTHPNVGASKGRTVARHSKFERERREAETERVKQIEAAWMGSLPTADRQGVRRVGRDRSRPRARGEATGHGARHRAATAAPRP